MKKPMAILCVVLLSGCASYRISSNIPAPKTAAVPGDAVIMLLEGEASTARAYETLGPVQVTVRKGNLFMAAPTRQQADQALRQKARDLGADAVIQIQYQEGFDILSWGLIKAEGLGIRFTD